MKLSIRTKLLAGFGLVLLLLALAIGVGIRAAGAVNTNAHEAFVDDAIPLKAAAQDLLTADGQPGDRRPRLPRHR